MSEETNNPEEQNAPQELDVPQELNVQQAFNLLVNLARQSKLSYDEHALVDKAVRSLSQALNLQE
jgi:hypothetical protein